MEAAKLNAPPDIDAKIVCLYPSNIERVIKEKPTNKIVSTKDKL